MIGMFKTSKVYTASILVLIMPSLVVVPTAPPTGAMLKDRYNDERFSRAGTRRIFFSCGQGRCSC